MSNTEKSRPLRVVVTRLTLDLNLTDIQKSVTFTRGDENRRFEITLVEGGRPFSLPPTWTAVLSGTKPSNNRLFNSCVVENGKIIYDFAAGPEISSEAGAFAIQFTIFDEVGQTLSSPKIWVSVIEMENREIASTDQFTALSQIIANNNATFERVEANEETREKNETARQALSAETIQALNATNEAVKQAEDQREIDENTRQTNDEERGERVDAAIQALNDTNTSVGQAEDKREAAENTRQANDVERGKRVDAAIQAINATNTAVGQAEDQREAAENAREALKTELIKLKTDLQEMVDALPDRVAELPALIERINAVLDSDDETLDELSEIVAYIKRNQNLINGITISKVNVADIVDNLVTNAANKPLSAAQGYKLKGLVDDAQATANGKEAAGTAAAMLNRTTPVNVDDTNYTAYMARGMSLNAEETSPTVYGTIAWHYK